MNKFAFLVIASLATLATANECIQRYCSQEMTTCFSDENCGRVLQCIRENCTAMPEVKCPYDCGLFRESTKLRNFVQCQANYGCLPKNKPSTGICYINKNDPPLNANLSGPSIFQTPDEPIKFWHLKGLNCNQSTTWYGGYDNVPCVSTTFFPHNVNRFYFCYGEHDECETEYQEYWTSYKGTEHPDIFQLHFWGKSTTHPHIVDVQVLSAPHPDWWMMAICAETPYVKINKVNIMSTNRAYSTVPQHVEDAFKATAARLGFSLDDMCEKDTTNCVNPEP